jgi:hypothetical protein
MAVQAFELPVFGVDLTNNSELLRRLCKKNVINSTSSLGSEYCQVRSSALRLIHNQPSVHLTGRPG